jgi:hypothetical protein
MSLDTPIESTMKIAIEKATEQPQSFYLTATTRGEVSASQKLLVSEAACSMTLTKDSAHD